MPRLEKWPVRGKPPTRLAQGQEAEEQRHRRLLQVLFAPATPPSGIALVFVPSDACSTRFTIAVESGAPPEVFPLPGSHWFTVVPFPIHSFYPTRGANPSPKLCLDRRQSVRSVRAACLKFVQARSHNRALALLVFVVPCNAQLRWQSPPRKICPSFSASGSTSGCRAVVAARVPWWR
jgi:hypothetical protein